MKPHIRNPFSASDKVTVSNDAICLDATSAWAQGSLTGHEPAAAKWSPPGWILTNTGQAICRPGHYTYNAGGEDEWSLIWTKLDRRRLAKVTIVACTVVATGT